jgi:hypothetical protein
MRKFLKIMGRIFGIILLVVAAFIAYLFVKYPDVGGSRTLKIDPTSERIARGQYLFNHVTPCVDCHSTRDWRYFSGPVVPGTEGKGGERFDESMGFPGTIVAKNITPAAIGRMSDGELFRAICEGVGLEGQALFPLMPYPAFANLSQEDLFALIAYVRTLKPIPNDVPKTDLNFPMNIIVRTIPVPYSPKPEPNRNNSYEYGKYLATAAVCVECHSPVEKGQIIPGREYAGGREFLFPNGTARSANLTPDQETGIGLWTKEIFLARFKEFAKADTSMLRPEKFGRQSVMPWTLFSGMNEDDLGAIYDYLRTVPPVRNRVEPWSGR